MKFHLDIKLSMSLSAGVTCNTNKIKITLGGSVELKAEVAFGTFINFTSGVKGKLIGASFICAFYTPSLKARTGTANTSFRSTCTWGLATVAHTKPCVNLQKAQKS